MALNNISRRSKNDAIAGVLGPASATRRSCSESSYVLLATVRGITTHCTSEHAGFALKTLAEFLKVTSTHIVALFAQNVVAATSVALLVIVAAVLAERKSERLTKNIASSAGNAGIRREVGGQK